MLQTSPSNRCWFLNQSSRIYLLVFKAALIHILALLRPHDFMGDDCPDHRPNDEHPKQDQQAGHNTSNDLDSVRLDDFANRKSSCDESSVWEDKREPGHGERESVSDTSPMRTNRDEKPE